MDSKTNQEKINAALDRLLEKVSGLPVHRGPILDGAKLRAAMGPHLEAFTRHAEEEREAGRPVDPALAYLIAVEAFVKMLRDAGVST